MKLEDRILRYLPLLGPVPVAYTVYSATMRLLSWPLWVSIPAALFVEGIGFVSINLAVRMYQFNRKLLMTEQKFKAPTKYAITASLLYGMTALLLTVLLDIMPTLQTYAPVAFILMSMNSGFLWALNSDQEKREEELRQIKARTRQHRMEKTKGTSSLQDQQVAPARTDKQKRLAGKLQVQGASKGDKLHPQPRKQERKQPVQDEALLAWWRDNPQASDGQVAEQFGTSRQAIQQRREKLIRKREITMTDKGVEIVGISVMVEPKPAENKA